MELRLEDVCILIKAFLDQEPEKDGSQVAVPYIDFLMDNISNQFSDKVVKLLVAMSAFHSSQKRGDVILWSATN